MIRRAVDALKRWADEHREWIVIGVALPAGTAAAAVGRAKAWLQPSPKPSDHDRRVSRLQEDVRRYAEARKAGEAWAQKPLRTDRKGAASLNVRISDKSASQTVNMSDLTNILEVDESRGVMRVEPFVTVGHAAAYLDQRGLQLEATIEMKDATLGGLVMALGMTTHSHVSGLVHDSVVAYEIVTAKGELLRVTADNEHADLFRALPWSHGTLGLLVALEMRVIPAPSHVRLVYRPFYSLDAYAKEYERLARAENPPHFIEVLIYGKNRAVLMEGYLATNDEVRNSGLPVNAVDKSYKRLFYKHVEGMLELGEGQRREELIPMYDYLMRHDRSMCMCLAQILPTANEAWFRYSMGWMLPPNMTFLKGTRPEAERENTIRKQVWQEFAFPAENFAEMVARAHEEFEIYPLLAYPCKVIDHGGIVRAPGNHGKPYGGKPETAAFLDLGIYGIPQRIQDGDQRFDTVTRVRRFEERVRQIGGFLHTYCDVFSTEEEFREMFDHSLWQEMRTKYEAVGAFPTIYDKVKPETDPLNFLAEERSWRVDSEATSQGDERHARPSAPLVNG